MSKKWFTIVMVVVLAMLLAACGGGDTETAAEPTADTGAVAEPTEETMAEEPAAEEPAEEPAAPSGDAIELQLMGWSSSDAENARLQEMVDTYNTNNPGVNVTLNQVPDYDTVLQTAIAGGQPPDVFYIDSFRLPDYVAANSLMPIGDQMDDPDDFYPSLRQAFTINDTFWCPPKDFSTLALQYNQDLFDAAGLEYPTPDWTWDDLRAAAEQLTDADAGVYGLVLPPDMARWIAFLYQGGGTVTNEDFTAMTLDSPEALEATDFYINMVLDGYAAQPSDLDSGWPGEAFGKGLAAMAAEGNWIVPFLNDQFPDLNWGVTELPGGPGGDATMAFTVCYGVAADAAHPDESIALANWLTGAEGMAQWTGLGLAMPTRASLSDAWLEQFPDLEPFLAGADYARPWQFRPGFSDVMNAFNSGLQQAFTGVYTSDQVLSDTQEAGTDILANQ